MLTRLRSRLRRSVLGRARRRLMAHRRLLAFLLTCAAVVVGLAATRPAAPPTATAVVAAHDLPAGSVVGTADVREVALPPEALPDGLLEDPVGRTLASPVRRGEPLTDRRLVGSALVEGHPGLTAVPVRFGDPGMASLLRVGDRIDLYATDPVSTTTDLVAGDVRVLALPEGATGPDGASDPAGAGAPAGGTPGGAGRLVVVGVSASTVPTLTGAGVSGFLTYAYSH